MEQLVAGVVQAAVEGGHHVCVQSESFVHVVDIEGKHYSLEFVVIDFGLLADHPGWRLLVDIEKDQAVDSQVEEQSDQTEGEEVAADLCSGVAADLC